LYWEFHEASAPARALRMGDLKLIEHGGRGGPRELYDLARDPGESTDLAHRRKADVARLYARMDAQRTEHPDWPLATYDPDRTARPASPGSAAGAGAAAASAPKR
jgi:arylsulfatase A-like enzyme